MSLDTLENVTPLRGTPERAAQEQGNFYGETSRLRKDRSEDAAADLPGMNPRIQRLRKKSFEAEPSLAIERALHQTAFYKAHNGKYSVPVMRALTFLDHCEKKSLYFDRDELIVGDLVEIDHAREHREVDREQRWLDRVGEHVGHGDVAGLDRCVDRDVGAGPQERLEERQTLDVVPMRVGEEQVVDPAGVVIGPGIAMGIELNDRKRPELLRVSP